MTIPIHHRVLNYDRVRESLNLHTLKLAFEEIYLKDTIREIN